VYLVGGLTSLLDDPVIALKTVALALHVTLTAAMFGVVQATARKRWCAALSAALLSVPTMHLFMLVEFVSNLGALAGLAVALLCMRRASDSGGRQWLWAGGVALA
jgi:hypothetical protein